jgi:hypothetical protein
VQPLEVSQEGAVAPVGSSIDEGLRVLAKDLNAMCYPLARGYVKPIFRGRLFPHRRACGRSTLITASGAVALLPITTPDHVRDVRRVM